MNMSLQPITIEFYQTSEGKEPFRIWLQKLKDVQARALINSRLTRIQSGNFGDAEPVADGVLELRIHSGPGYRVYCARHKESIVILLCGGDKKTQDRDIEKAKTYWKDHRSRHNE